MATTVFLRDIFGVLSSYYFLWILNPYVRSPRRFGGGRWGSLKFHEGTSDGAGEGENLNAVLNHWTSLNHHGRSEFPNIHPYSSTWYRGYQLKEEPQSIHRSEFDIFFRSRMGVIHLILYVRDFLRGVTAIIPYSSCSSYFVFAFGNTSAMSHAAMSLHVKVVYVFVALWVYGCPSDSKSAILWSAINTAIRFAVAIFFVPRTWTMILLVSKIQPPWSTKISPKKRGQIPKRKGSSEPTTNFQVRTLSFTEGIYIQYIMKDFWKIALRALCVVLNVQSFICFSVYVCIRVSIFCWFHLFCFICFPPSGLPPKKR